MHRPGRRVAHGQLRLALSPTLSRAVIDEASRRGLSIEASAGVVGVRLVGEIGAHIAGLNAAMERAAAAGIDVVLIAHYQPTEVAHRKRCVLTGQMRRLALDVRL